MWPDAAILRIASGTEHAAVSASHQEGLLTTYVPYLSEGPDSANNLNTCLTLICKYSQWDYSYAEGHV